MLHQFGFTSLYRSPSQNKDQFDDFFLSLNMAMSKINDKKPLVSIITGDFSATYNNCWFISRYHELIIKPTHMTRTNSSTVDLIFTSNPNLITKFCYEKCFYTDSYPHRTLFVKMNLKVPLPSPYTREVWDNNKADKKYLENQNNL